MFEWTQPARIVSPYGTLLLNQDLGDGRIYLAVQGSCSVQRSLRVTKDQVPQGDGAILHRRFADGTEMRYQMEYWEDGGSKIACAETAREMAEDLALHLGGILNGDGRLYWQPSDYSDERLLDNARWFVELTHDWSSDRPVAKFGIDGPFPYFIDKTEVDVPILDAGTGSSFVTITNTGNADFYPVIIVDGPTSGFTIENETTGLKIVYDSSRPGAIAIGSGDIGEFDCFRNTAYLGIGGEPGNDTNLKPGVDPELTDYFALIPGANDVSVIGADITVKTNNAWIPS
jgi:hypothetical protein